MYERLSNICNVHALWNKGKKIKLEKNYLKTDLCTIYNFEKKLLNLFPFTKCFSYKEAFYYLISSENFKIQHKTSKVDVQKVKV